MCVCVYICVALSLSLIIYIIYYIDVYIMSRKHMICVKMCMVDVWAFWERCIHVGPIYNADTH